MSSPRLSSPERRAAIIESAIRLFSEKGLRGTTTRELASAVGVSEPILYQHFTTKNDLYGAILEQLATAGENVIPQIVATQSAEPMEDRRFLTQLANGIIDWHVQNPAYVRLLLLSALENHEFHDMFYTRYSKSFLEGLVQFFAHRIEIGHFRPMDPNVAVHSFIGLIAHYALHRTVFNKSQVDLPQDQMVNGFIDIFLKGMQSDSHR